MAQLVLLAYQVKSGIGRAPDPDVGGDCGDSRWPGRSKCVRSGVTHFAEQLPHAARHAGRESARCATELGRLKMENQYLRERAVHRGPGRGAERISGAHAIAHGGGASDRRREPARTSKVVFVDRGIGRGVEKGMAVVTPDGIVGKVMAAYPNASQVLLITDSSFAAGVISQKNHVHGILKGSGLRQLPRGLCADRRKRWKSENGSTLPATTACFPKGMPAGQVTAVRPGSPFQEILVEPSGTEERPGGSADCAGRRPPGDSGRQSRERTLPCTWRRHRPPFRMRRIHPQLRPLRQPERQPEPTPTACASATRKSATRRSISSERVRPDRNRLISI